MSRYGTVPSSFWQADPATAGLGSLAACLLLRARSESLVGVLRYSLRSLANAHHDATPTLVGNAIAELESRGLVRWWPDLEILATVGGATSVKGDAAKAVEGVLADLPAQVAAVLRGLPPPVGEGVAGGVGTPRIPVVHPPCQTGPDLSEQEQEQQQEQEQDQDPVGSPKRRPSTPARAARARPKGARSIPADQLSIVTSALARLTVLRREVIGPRCGPQTLERDGAHMLKRVAEGVTLDQLLLVLEAEAAKVREGGESAYFDAVTPFRDSNWSKRLAAAEAWDARQSRQRPARTEAPHLTTAARLREQDAQQPPPASSADLERVLPAWARSSIAEGGSGPPWDPDLDEAVDGP